LVPTGFAARHYRFDLWPDDVPYLTPALLAHLAKGAGMLVLTNAGTVAVVIELDEIFAPPQKHGMSRAQQRVDRGEQRDGPLGNRADGSLAPIEGARQIGHFACAEDFVSLRIGRCRRNNFVLLGCK